MGDEAPGDPLRHVKPVVRAISAYTLALREARVKINQNENPWDLPEHVKRRVVERALARPWARYPDFDPHELLAALAGFSGWRADGILAGNGSNEMIEALLLVTVGDGTRVVIPEPTFTLYPLMTKILGGEPVRVQQVPASVGKRGSAPRSFPGTGPAQSLASGDLARLDATGRAAPGDPAHPDATGRATPGDPARAASDEGGLSFRGAPARPGDEESAGDGAAGLRILRGESQRTPLRMTDPAAGDEESAGLVYDVEAISRARRESAASVTIICSPNNPTGSSLALADIERLCQENDSLVVIDEAYHEFAGESAVPLLARHPNLVVLRTFSKAMALAGLRVGYLMASPELVREINKARLPYNVNFFSQAAAIAALEEQEALAGMVARLVSERGRLLAALASVPGVRAWPSRANFFILELLEADPKAVFASLLRRGVLVRDVTSYPLLSRCLRVSVGSPEENDTFLHALGTALVEAGTALETGRA